MFQKFKTTISWQWLCLLKATTLYHSLFPFFYHMSCCPDIVVKLPQNLQVPNISEESGCAAKNAFQEVPYSQSREEVVLNGPEAAYKRLLEACGRMPRKSN